MPISSQSRASARSCSSDTTAPQTRAVAGAAAKLSTIWRQKAGRSSGFRLEMIGPAPVAHDDLAVDPLAAGVPDVGGEARPAGQLPTTDDVGFDQSPRAVADDGQGPARVDRGPHQIDGLGHGAEVVGVGHPAGQEHSVELVRQHLPRRRADAMGADLVQVVEGLHVAGLRSDQHRRRPRLLQCLHRLDELDLLHALVGHEYRDPAS